MLLVSKTLGYLLCFFDRFDGKIQKFCHYSFILAKKQFTLTTSKLIRLLDYCIIMRDILPDTFLGALTEIPAPLNVGLQDGMDASVL